MTGATADWNCSRTPVTCSWNSSQVVPVGRPNHNVSGEYSTAIAQTSATATAGTASQVFNDSRRMHEADAVADDDDHDQVVQEVPPAEDPCESGGHGNRERSDGERGHDVPLQRRLARPPIGAPRVSPGHDA